MAGKVITPREKQLVIDQYAQGWPLRKIAAYANISQTTVLKIVRESGIPMREGKTHTKPVRERVLDLYRKGYKIPEIMTETGIQSTQTIYAILGNSPRRRIGKPTES